MTASMLENCAAGCTPDNQPCCCMGLHVCCTHSGKQCWFGRLATSTIASTRTTHLLLLWVERKSQVGAVKSTCKGHTGRALSKRSNKEACNMKAQGHAAHMSTQDSVAEAACYFRSVQACLMTRLYKHIVNYALAKRCLVGTRSM
jgi:hypothetical protein